MTDILKGFYDKKNFRLRFVIVNLAVFTMGFALSFLLLIDLGTDPCTLMNVAISSRLGISLGNWQALMNTVLLIIVVFFGARNLGFGTLSNMFLVGYTIDFFSWLWKRTLPLEAFQLWSVRIAVLIPSLVIFVLAAALYMVVDMGTAPYDAIPFVISMRLPKVPFRTIRMIFDFSVIIIGCLFGGKIGIVTLLMALTIGPVVGWLGDYIQKHSHLLA